MSALTEETIKRLNRRAQHAESVARDNVNACRKAGVKLKGTLMCWLHEDMKRRLREVIDGKPAT